MRTESVLRLTRFCMVLFAVPPSAAWTSIPSSTSTTKLLADALSSEFANSAQAMKDERFRDVRVWFRPITCSNEEEFRQFMKCAVSPWDMTDGCLCLPLYQESAMIDTLAKPYKQSVVFVVFADNMMRLHSHKLCPAAKSKFAGMAKFGSDGPLQGIFASDLEARQTGCDMIVGLHFSDQNMRFEGRLECTRGCRFAKNERDTYLDSNFELLLDDSGGVKHYLTEDRFFDLSSGKQVWGSEHGPYAFERTLHWGLPDPDASA